MYAIIRDRGKQHRVEEGQVLELDLMSGSEAGQILEFNEVLMTSDGNGGINLGTPTLEGSLVTAKVVEPVVKGQKIDVVHFRRRKDSMSKVGHRQKYTRVSIEKIQG